MDTTAPVRGTAVVAIAAMTVSMLPLFVLGALGPALVRTYRIAPSTLGILVAAGFFVATLLSIPGGALVDRIGPRRSLVSLFLLSGCGLAVLALSQGLGSAICGVALGGIPQALANPATNKAIVMGLPVHRRGSVLGLKQSGVQLGAFVAGAPLASSAALIGWRAGVALLACSCFALAALTVKVLPVDSIAANAPRSFVVAQPRLVWGLSGFSMALGFGTVSVNTYLVVYAVQRIGLSEVAAGTLVAALGVAGIVGRIGWSRFAAHRDDPATVLPLLAVGAVASTGVLLAAMSWNTGVLWLGAAGIGAFAVAANAVSMLAVVRGVPSERAGRASAVVSAGFFAGFAVGPLVSGGLLHLGYGWMWCAVAAAFVLAGVIAVVAATTRQREVEPI